MRLKTFRTIHLLCGLCFFLIGIAVFGIGRALTQEVHETPPIPDTYHVEGLGLAITVISMFYLLFTLNANVTDNTAETAA
jgi:hypothetical protein